MSDDQNAIIVDIVQDYPVVLSRDYFTYMLFQSSTSPTDDQILWADSDGVKFLWNTQQFTDLTGNPQEGPKYEWYSVRALSVVYTQLWDLNQQLGLISSLLIGSRPVPFSPEVLFNPLDQEDWDDGRLLRQQTSGRITSLYQVTEPEWGFFYGSVYNSVGPSLVPYGYLEVDHNSRHLEGYVTGHVEVTWTVSFRKTNPFF